MINQARTPALVGDNDKVMVANEKLMPNEKLMCFVFFPFFRQEVT